MPAETIDIVVAVDDNYARAVGPVACAAKRFLPSTTTLRVHVLDGGVSPASKRALTTGLEGRAEVVFYEVRNQMAWTGLFSRDVSHLNDSVLLRLQMGEVLPSQLTRVIYLDVDVLVHGDLSTLWSWPLDGRPVGAIRDRFMPSGSPTLAEVLQRRKGYVIDRYFNSGVLVIDLEAWRDQGIGEAVRAVITERGQELRFPCQDTLNYALVDNWHELPSAWNYLVGKRCPIPGTATALRILASDGIVHFIGGTKPWHEAFPRGVLWTQFAEAAAASGWDLTEQQTVSAYGRTEAWKTR
jgi:lipopolysaccharide biosynthesis glycosyltransferase